MRHLTRRGFLRTAAASTAAASVPFSVWANPEGANGDIRVAIVGIGNKGRGHLKTFRGMQGVRVVALCDPDKSRTDGALRQFGEQQSGVTAYQDIRKLLENKDIDAVCVATCNHWHALATVWACQAGKDVYVEKPASYNVWEGQQMVKAAEKYGRIVQQGTQTRSDSATPEIIDYIRGGNLGKILAVRGFCYKRRASIGKVSGPQEPPASVDYDLWTGPAPLKPLMRKGLHYNWHWVWDTGNGDLGNQGIHEMDQCRWVLGVDHLSPRVMSIGGRFGYDDDGETANTQIVYHDYDEAPIIFEVRGLPMEAGMNSMDHYRGTRVGIAVECEGGYYSGKHGGWICDKDGKRIKQFKGGGAGSHQANFIKAVRSRKASDNKCDIREGHLSSALCHTGNISHRIGQGASPDAIMETIKGKHGAEETFGRFKEHLGKNGIDIGKTPAVLGPWLEMDPKTEQFKGAFAKEASALAKREQRKPFVIPEKV